MSSPAISIQPYLAEAETLTAAEWTTILGITKAAFGQRGIEHAGMEQRQGGLTRLYPFEALPADWQTKAEETRKNHLCRGWRDLLDAVREESPALSTHRTFESLPAATQARAMHKRDVLRVYYSALESGCSAGGANLRAQAEYLLKFGKACNEKTIRRWAKEIDALSVPFDDVPIVFFADNKSCPHLRARREAKLEIPFDLIGHFKALCCQEGMLNIMGAYRAIEIAWQQQQPVPGLGIAPQPMMRLPWTYEQLRPFAPSTPARLQGNRGKAVARNAALPTIQLTTSRLRRMELVLLDDTRVDIMALDNQTGRPVQMELYMLIDVGPRRIEGFVLREAGGVKATDVDALVARALRSAGLPVGYPCSIRFERGTVACSPAREAHLLATLPGRLKIDRTAMHGGRNNPGAFVQMASGRWHDKKHVESLMRTVAFGLQHVIGQRGSTYQRQPAALGLRNANQLDYSQGSQIHQGHLLASADRAMALLSGDLDQQLEQAAANHTDFAGRLKISALCSVRQVMDAIQSFVAWYNNRTDHRMEGFARLEYLDQQTGKPTWRMQSPNERAWDLASRVRMERISDATCSALMLRARKVTVHRNGVTVDLDPYKGLRFWKEDSLAITEALRLTTTQRECIALFDPEAITDPNYEGPKEIYLLANPVQDYDRGELKKGSSPRFLESLPLEDPGQLLDPEELAKLSGERQRVAERYAAELTRATTTTLSRRLAEANDNIDSMQAVVTHSLRVLDDLAPDSEHVTDIESARAQSQSAPSTRKEQQTQAQSTLAAKMAALKTDQTDQ